MTTYKEINEFLSNFNVNSYNKKQIGSNNQEIINIYKFLRSLNISKDSINLLIKNIAYLNAENINIPLYLELLSKSLGFTNNHKLSEVIKVVKEIHDIYYNNSQEIDIEEYLDDTLEIRAKKLFLNDNYKHIKKQLDNINISEYISELKFICAILLKKKEYKEFVGYLNSFEKYTDSYSPILMFKTYNTIRLNLKKEKRLFWDILLGNEYLVSLVKHNIPVKEIYKKNIFEYNIEDIINEDNFVQLDMFDKPEEEKTINIKESIPVTQICTIYNSGSLADFAKEKDLLLYLEQLLSNKELIILPKLKEKKINSYIYEIN